MSALSITTPWKAWRENLLRAAEQPADGWLDEDEIRDVLSEANREGISARTVLTCRKAEAMQLPDETTSGVTPTGHRPIILLVEPDAEYADKIRRILSATNRYEVSVVADSRAALRFCKHRQPDLLITEMNLPQSTNGTGLAHYIRLVMNRRIPVIILESVLQGTDVSIVSTRNALHLRKPLKLKSLLHCVVHLLRVVV
jgi:CheY-like chemotaxis protein